MFYYLACDRKRFAEFVIGRVAIPSKNVATTDSLREIVSRNEDMVVVWASNPSHEFSLPRVVIVDDDEHGDFLAWASTYFRHIRPFTAHCRVLTPKLTPHVDDSGAAAWMSCFRSLDVGLVVAEAITYSVGHTDVSRLALSAFTRTLSYAISRSLRLYSSIDNSLGSLQQDVQVAWSLMRETVGETPLQLSPQTVCNVWDCVITSAQVRARESRSSTKNALASAVNDIITHGHVLRDNWSALAEPLRDPDSTWNVMEGPREGRVLAVEASIQELATGTSKDKMNRAALAGYLVSRVKPGTLEHFQLLFPVLDTLPEALLWYGACAGLSHESTVENYANGVGWLMRRELGRGGQWIDRPTCDIALRELEILMRDREQPLAEFPTKTSGVLDVELLPLVTSSVRWAPSEKRPDKAQPSTQRSLFGDGAEVAFEVREVLRRIEESAMSLDAIRQQVERTFGKEVKRKRGR